MTFVISTALVECAPAQYSDPYDPSASQASSVAVSEHSAATQNVGLLPPPVLASAPAASIANLQAPTTERVVNSPVSTGRPNAPGRTSLEMISPQAQAHINYALNLAERGAVQSAQAEFVIALDLIADALDADTWSSSREHARAVQAGLTAIEEARDFVPADTPHNVVINLAQLAATHQTPVLKNIDAARMTRAEVLQRYHSYAAQQLAFGGGRSAIASSALYGLGRAECVTTAGAGSRNPLGAPNAMALYQAALLINPQNYMASNELGVLMARYGDLDGAADQLTRSLAIKPQVETWHNLAAVYRGMGQAEKAEQAEQEREKLVVAARSGGAVGDTSTDLGSRPALQLVDADTFAASTTPYGFDGPAGSSNTAASVAQHDSMGKRLIAKLNPWQKADKPQQNADMPQSSQRVDPSRVDDAAGRAQYK